MDVGIYSSIVSVKWLVEWSDSFGVMNDAMEMAVFVPQELTLLLCVKSHHVLRIERLVSKCREIQLKPR